MGRYDIAIADYTKAISIEPRDAGLLIDQGNILAKVGRDREAISNFSHALDVESPRFVNVVSFTRSSAISPLP
jgi:Flp pilus assembly protein TadD